MNVLFVNNHLHDHIGGAELNDFFLANQLSYNGVNVSYFILNAKKNDYDVPYEFSKIYNSFSFVYAIKAIKRHNPKIIYYSYLKRNLLIWTLLAKIFRIKIIFRVNSIDDAKAWNYSKPKKIPSLFRYEIRCLFSFYKSFINYINHISFLMLDGTSFCQKKLMSVVSKKHSRKDILLYNMIISNGEGIFEWERPFVVWVANLKDGKNPHLLVKTAEYFIDKVDFLMIGDIQDKKYDYIRDKRNLPRNLTYLGKKTPSEVDNIIKSSLFLVHTCEPEGFGMNFIQAWKLGKATVSLYFDPDGLIGKYQVGIVSGKLEKFVSDINLIIEDCNLRSYYEKNTKFIYNNEFSEEIITSKTINYFEEILRYTK